MYFISNPAYALKHFVYNVCIHISVSMLEMPRRHTKLLTIATGKRGGVRKGDFELFGLTFEDPVLKILIALLQVTQLHLLERSPPENY